MHLLSRSLFLTATIFALSNVTHANVIKPVLPDSESLTWVQLSTLPGVKYTVINGNPFKKDFFVVRLTFPADYKIPPHYHNINEFDTVISGTLYMGSGSNPNLAAHALPAGSFVKIPAKAVHYGWTQEETTLQVMGIGPWGATYLKQTAKKS